MKRNMLEYTKMILQKVSFDRKLFEKELSKAQRELRPKEKHELMNWVKTTYQIQEASSNEASSSLA